MWGKPYIFITFSPFIGHPEMSGKNEISVGIIYTILSYIHLRF